MCLFRRGHPLDRRGLTLADFQAAEHLAHSLAKPFALVHRPHPVALPEVAINVFWHAKVHCSPAHRWRRSVVFELFGNAGPVVAGAPGH